jgi:hypothetical protein
LKSSPQYPERLLRKALRIRKEPGSALPPAPGSTKIAQAKGAGASGRPEVLRRLTVQPLVTNQSARDRSATDTDAAG